MAHATPRGPAVDDQKEHVPFAYKLGRSRCAYVELRLVLYEEFNLSFIYEIQAILNRLRTPLELEAKALSNFLTTKRGSSFVTVTETTSYYQ
jgi:hypothetical protein